VRAAALEGCKSHVKLSSRNRPRDTSHPSHVTRYTSPEAQVVGYDDGGVEGAEVEHGDWRRVHVQSVTIITAKLQQMVRDESEGVIGNMTTALQEHARHSVYILLSGSITSGNASIARWPATC
jgi:hypothetical protein